MQPLSKTKLAVLALVTILLIATLVVIAISKLQSKNNGANLKIVQKTTTSNSSLATSSIIPSAAISLPLSQAEAVSVPLKSSYNSILSGADFKEIYDKTKYNHVKTNVDTINIFDNPQADNYISKKAEARGYSLHQEADSSRLVEVENSQILQPEAKEAFLNLKNRALQDGISLTLVSGFRSVELQKTIFVSRLGIYSPAAILNGSTDQQIEAVLDTTSVPGYSRHHTGYTFDLGCNSQQLTIFKNTPCYQWISNNNYQIAKEFGLIPSYPDGAANQGPEPEAWEYVWVGKEVLNN